MPPANSPSDTPLAGTARTPLIEQLAELAAPVPDLASTLTMSNTSLASDDAPTMSESIWPPHPVPLAYSARRSLEDVSRQQPGQGQSVSTRPRVRLPTTGMSYRDWAQSSGDEQMQSTSRSSQTRQMPSPLPPPRNRATRRHHREQQDQSATSALVDPTTDRIDWESSNPDWADQDRRNLANEHSLRSAALLSSARRHIRLSHLRDPPGEPVIESPERRHSEDRRAQMEILERQNRARLQLVRNERHRRPRPGGIDTLAPEAQRWLEGAIKYLARLRFCESHAERLAEAEISGFLRRELFKSRNFDDFLLNTTLLPTPQPTSWLRPGGTFIGSQRAAPFLAPPALNLRSASQRNASSTHVPLPPTMTADGTGASDQPSSRWIEQIIGHSSHGTSHGSGGDESWPVKVTINSIDYAAMTLTGTMEALHVPHKGSIAHVGAANHVAQIPTGTVGPNGESNITTHLEGEILDFNRFSLETTSFNADLTVDSTYWRKLEPFKSLAEDDLAHKLTSSRWLSEELGQKWILMRWKEKCFVNSSDAHLEVTISGFYYISLRRDTGVVEGLYYDPLSSPYQHLTLRPGRRFFPAYSFT